MSGPILIVGATGQQGGAVIRSLQTLPNPPALRALTRSVDSAKSLELKKQGVEVVKGTLEDVESLKTALTGASAAFLGEFADWEKDLYLLSLTLIPAVTTIPGKGGVSEDQQGLNFIAAAEVVKLPYIVFSSVSDASPTCGVPHFETKAKVEEALKQSSLKHAIIAPVAFYDNFPRQSSFATFMALGLFDAGLYGKTLQMVATEDIGECRLAPQYSLNQTDTKMLVQATSPRKCSSSRTSMRVAKSNSQATSSRWPRSAIRTPASRSRRFAKRGCPVSSSISCRTTCVPCSGSSTTRVTRPTSQPSRRSSRQSGRSRSGCRKAKRPSNLFSRSFFSPLAIHDRASRSVYSV